MSDVEAETAAEVEQEAGPSSPTAPPAYESIVLSDPEPAPAVSEIENNAAASGGNAYPSPPAQPPGARLVARVTEPVKIGDGMTAHAAYVVAVESCCTR